MLCYKIVLQLYYGITFLYVSTYYLLSHKNYREKWERVNVSWTEDGEAVNFGTKKTYFFRRDLSVGSEDDLMTLPNIPMIVSKKYY